MQKAPYLLLLCFISIGILIHFFYPEEVRMQDEPTKNQLVRSNENNLENSELKEELSECQKYYRDEFLHHVPLSSFDEYPVDKIYDGIIAELDLESHSVAKRFYTHHVKALEDAETQFAGKYRISHWGFTGWGDMFAVISLEDGKVYPFPYAVDWDFSYQADSNLIIINPPEKMPDFKNTAEDADIICDMKWYEQMRTYYFIFEDGEFTLLGPEENFNLTTSPWLEDELLLE